MAGKVKTWMWVAAGITIVGILGLIATAGAGIYFFSRHIQTGTESPAAAARAFDDVAAHFAAQKPLIELDSHGRYLRSNTDRPTPADTQPPETLRVMAFEPKDGRIVRIGIPFWLLRLKLRSGAIDFNGNRVKLEDLKLTVEDLERYGPTLVVDHRSPSGERVVVWTE